MRPNLYTLFGEVDQINIYNGYVLSNQKRKFVFYQNGKQVKMISTQLEGIGEEKKGQVFLWSNEVDVAYQCTPKSKIIVMDISDSELYYIKPIDCIVISDIYKP
ncbi:hypothetical protein [Psychrobacter lutiphocae]|uniref:hypothetical protein n=1 Tax=Psychrobacter lutiphocae TaxID=540500 RepID=UPI00191A7D81|nr:hypothetical protein [Psychrobacter lutiphocae]